MLRTLLLYCPHSRKDKIERLAGDVFGKGNVFLKNVFALESLPEGLHSFPEIAFIGSPNTGKSSIIGALLHNKRLGRPGSRPGNTRSLQFFSVGNALAVVDTPGYGAWMGKMENRQFLQARAFGILFQYLSARKLGNLRHVYWCFSTKKDKPLRINAREDELLTFLRHEKIPFTVLLTKCDLAGSHSAKDMETLASFVGEGTRALQVSSRHPYDNMDRLQCDMVAHVSQSLCDADLTVNRLRELSYLPLTALEQMSIERRYPKEEFVIPLNNFQTMQQLIEEHSKAKIGFIEHRRFESVRGSMERLELATQSPLIGYQDDAPAGSQIEAVHALLEQSGVSPTSTPLLDDQGPKLATSPGGSIAPVAAASLEVLPPVAQCRLADGVSPAFPPLLLPKSIISPALREGIATEDKRSLAHFEEQQKAFSIEAVYSKEDIFTAPQVSRSRNFRQEIHQKYMGGGPRRTAVPTCEGYACPWLGARDESRVCGLEHTDAGVSRGGTEVRHLKQRGFGGNSLSPYTLRNKGHSTTKVGRWAR